MLRTEDDYVCEILRMEKPLRAILHRFAPQPADLDDLLQETYSRLLSLPPQRRQVIQNLQAFAIVTARNVAMDWLRRRQVVSIETVEDMSALPMETGATSLDEIVDTHQQLLSLANGIATLPERCRDVFTLRRVYGLTQKEIASRLQISEGAVEQFLVRGMRRCVEVMQAEDHASRRAEPRRGWLERVKRGLGKRGEPG